MRARSIIALWMALALLVAYGICCNAGQPLLFAPLAGTAVIVFGAPHSDMSRWRAALGGHVVSAIVALLCLHWAPPGALGVAMVVSSALAFFLMMCSDTVHSPAGATSIALVGLRDLGASPALVLGHVLLALLAILLIAHLMRTLGGGHSAVQPLPRPIDETLGLQRSDET